MIMIVAGEHFLKEHLSIHICLYSRIAILGERADNRQRSLAPQVVTYFPNDAGRALAFRPRKPQKSQFLRLTTPVFVRSGLNAEGYSERSACRTQFPEKAGIWKTPKGLHIRRSCDRT